MHTPSHFCRLRDYLKDKGYILSSNFGMDLEMGAILIYPSRFARFRWTFYEKDHSHYWGLVPKGLIRIACDEDTKDWGIDLVRIYKHEDSNPIEINLTEPNSYERVRLEIDAKIKGVKLKTSADKTPAIKLTHLNDPSSRMVRFPAGSATATLGYAVGHALAYCGVACERRKTETFYEAVNYTGAGLAKIHKLPNICPECSKLFEEQKAMDPKPGSK